MFWLSIVIFTFDLNPLNVKDMHIPNILEIVKVKARITIAIKFKIIELSTGIMVFDVDNSTCQGQGFAHFDDEYF